MAGQCRDGVPLPDYGPCPECGAEPHQVCRTKAWGQAMRMQAGAEKEARARRLCKSTMDTRTGGFGATAPIRQSIENGELRW